MGTGGEKRYHSVGILEKTLKTVDGFADNPLHGKEDCAIITLYVGSEILRLRCAVQDATLRLNSAQIVILGAIPTAP